MQSNRCGGGVTAAVERIIGVDFGTSTSVIRVKRYENGKPLGEKLDTKGVIFGNGSLSEMVPSLSDIIRIRF